MAGRLQIPLHPTRRSLWMQTLVWVGGVILVFLILLYALSQIILLDGFRDLETQAAQQEIQRTQNMLFAELDVLNTTAMDWAFWDETLDFVQTGDPAYIDANLMDATFDSLGLNLLLFYNTAGELVYGKTYDLAAQREVPFWTDSETIMGNDPTITHLTDPMASIRGIIMLPDGPMYIVTYPILTSHHEGPARGTLTMGRFLTGETVERLSEISPGQVKLFRLTDDTLPADVRASLPTTTKPIIKRMNGQTIVSYIRIDDIHDQPIMALAFAAPRDIYRQSNDLIRSFLVITVLGSIGIIITIAIWLQRSVLTRLTMLSSTVREIGQSGDLDVRVPTGEHTELNSLAESINLMLAGLAESHGEQTRAVDTRTQQLIKERDMLRILIDNLPERLYVKDTQGRFVVANATIARRYELPRAKDLIGKTDFDLQAPDIAQTLFAEEQALMQGEIPVIEHEFNHTFDNAPGWLWTVKLPLRNHEGHIIGLVGIGRDITERKLMENALREAHDELEQRVEERTAELTLANLRLKLEIAEREQVQKALTANERTARDFQEHLKALHEIGLELGQITELDKLYRRAIELGRSQLGFERLGLWRLSQDEQNMIGTFGIDTAGNLRDERHLRNAVTNDPFVQQVLQQPTHLAVWQNKELLDNWEPIGRGWGAMAALWDGSRTIGWLSTDNLLTQTPPSPYQAELLQLYGSALGHHIARLEMEAELRASEHRYSSLFNGVPAPLYRTAPDGQMLEINPALVELLGYTDVKALQQLTVDQLYVQPEMREHWRDVIERENMLRDFETQIVQADGSIIWVQDTAHVVRWPDGSVRYYEGNLKDITARKRAETKLAEAMERLHNHAHELATVAEISRQMTKILDIDQLLWTVCDLIKTNFSLYYAQIYLLDPAGEKLTLAAGSGEEGRALVTHKHNIPVQKSQSLVARAYRTHAPVVTNNVFEAIDFLPNVLLPRTRSEIAVPMLIGDQLIGVLDVQSDILDRFTERDTNIMISLAAQSAIAIHNARLFTENARRLALIENSTDLIALADMKTFELLYINPAGLKLLGLTQPDEFMASRIQDFYPPEIQHTWRRTIRPSLERTGVWRDENTITRADGTNIPVEQTVLAIGEHDAPPHTLATIITDITERKRSEESLQRANRAFHTLSDCNQAMVRATDTINLLNEICQIIVATSGYQMAWASIVDPDQPEQILPIAVAGDECGFLDIIFSDERDPEQHPGPSVRAIRDNRPIVINDIAHDPDYAHFSAHALARSYHSMIALPLVSGEQIIGTLGAYAALPHTFDDQEITLMTELASDLAYGITVLRTRAERQNALHQVRQHEANLTAILENTDASIWSVDRDFRLVACNTGFTQLLALFTDAAVKPGMPVDVLPAERATFWTDLYTRALAGVHFRTEIHYELAEIPGFDMEMALNPIVSDTGEIAGVTVFGRDITARKQHLAQLKQLNDELLALHDMGRTLTATLDIQAIYRLLYEEIAQKRFGAPSFFVSVYDDTEQLITCDFAVIDGGEVNPTQLRPLPLGDSPLSETIRTRQARQVDYPASDEDPPDTGHSIRVGDPTTPYIRSALYMPLISQDRVIGVISLQHYEAEAFRTADLQLLTTLANQAAAAIQNARLFAAEHRQRVYAETLRDIAAAVNKTLNLDNVLSSIFENIKRVVPHDAANIMIIEDGQAHVMGSSIAHHYDLQTWGQSASFDVQNNRLMRTICETGQPLIVPDVRHEPDWEIFPETEWQRSSACAPIMREDTVIGFLNVYSRAAQTYTPQHATYLRAFAIQAGNAIRNAQLYASERDQRMLSEALRNTAATVNSTLDFDSVLKGILDHVGRVVPHDAANIMLIDGDTIRISHGYGYDELSGVEGRLDNWQINIADIPHLQHMITEQKPLLVSDVAHDPLWVDVDPVDRWIRCSLKVPIRLEEQVVGVLNLDNATPNSFTPQHVDRLQAFADQVATAIRNAQLFTATQQHAITYQEQANRLALINRVSARIAQAITLDDIYEIMTQELQAALDVSFAGLVMYEGTEGRLVMDTHPDHDQHRDRNVSAANNPSLDYMCQTHDVIISADALNDPLFETTWDLLRERGTQSIMVIPLVVENKVIGSLGLDSTTKRHFTSAEAEIAETIVNQAAVAITKAQLLASECDQRMFAETLHNTAEAINRTLDLDQILDRILENIKRLIPHDAANIIFVDGEWLEVMRCTGYETYGTAEAMRNLRVKIDATINWRTIITTKESLIVADTQETPGWMRKVHLNSWIRSTVKAPILLNEDIIGVLSLDSATPHAFDERHAERLQAFAFQAANAIRNARSFAGERDQRQLAEALRDTAKIVNSTLDFDVVLDNILTTISRVVPHDAANIMLIENGVARIARGFGYEKYGADEWARQRNFPVEQTPIWHTMLDTGQPMVVPMTKQDPKWPQMPEEDWIESTVKAPIKIEGKIIGILHLDSTTPGAFNQNHAERLQPFADQAAIAIRNAQLFAAEHRQRTLAETLRDTANAVAGSISLVDAAQRILENVGRVVPHDAANIMVFNWKTNTARTVASRGYVAQGRSGEKHGLEVSLDLAINPEFDRLVIIPDTHNEPDWFTLPGDEWVRSYISAPIRLQDESIGVINLDCKTPDFYTEDHADRLKIFANQAAIAIERAQLFEAVQHHADELEQRVAQRTEELNQQRRQLEAILDAMSEGVLYDTKLDVKYINPALTRLTGYQRDEFINYISVLRRPDQPASDFTAMVNNLYDKVKRRGFWQEDTRLSRKDGSEFDASLTVTPVHDNEERLIGTVTVIRDISQEKALQEQKDRFIANASHELRTPLANIKTRLYLLQHQPEKMAQHLDIINRVSNHMADLVENLLDVSRFDRGVIILNRRNTVLQTIVEDVTAIQQAEAEQKDVAFHVHLHPTPLVVSIDPQRMNQVITNLVANAINYTEAGGSISVELTREQASAVLRVQDTGIGIKPEMVAHVFEPFFRADEKVTIGTGLGLTIVHDIVTLHGGTITVDSVLGAGSTFTVRLDLIE